MFIKILEVNFPHNKHLKQVISHLESIPFMNLEFVAETNKSIQVYVTYHVSEY